MMKKIGYPFILFMFVVPFFGVVRSSSTHAAAFLAFNGDSGSTLIAKNTRKKRTRVPRKRTSRTASKSELIQALRLVKQNNYTEASKKLFQLSVNPRYKSKKLQLKYLLGLMLYQMKLNQVAAFQFISVVKDGKSKYLRQSLEKMSLAADFLGDDTLLNYALARVKVNEFPGIHRDMLYYRIGEFQLANQQFASSIGSLDRVDPASNYFSKAKYLQAMAYAEQGQAKKSVRAFEQLANMKADQGITNDARVAALIGKARALYQAKLWDEAIDAYREIPKDTVFWHDSIFETSWAMLRSGQFRSALSNFHTLHSSYYESAYQPESLLLRSIIYMYICKYSEMEKVLNLYLKIYDPVYKSIKRYIKGRPSSNDYFEQVYAVRDFSKGKDEELWKNEIPYLVAKKIYNEGDFQRTIKYLQKLEQEKRQIDAMPGHWKSSAIGRYSAKVVSTRIAKAKVKAGRIAKSRLDEISTELFDLFEQQDFIRFEMLKGRKDSLKQKLAGKDLSDVQIDEETERDFYIQNGYEYWPFKGEYWLDELGNYHYLGVQSCE